MFNLSGLDSYERTARLAPGLLILAPVALAVVGFGISLAPWSATMGGAALAVVGPIVLSRHVGNRGRSREKRLYTSWGGAPTTLLLSPPPSGSPGPIVMHRRSNVEAVTGVELPTSRPRVGTAEEETYWSAVLSLRSKTADAARFPRVNSENVNYGFERNLLGSKPEGLAVSSASVLALAVGLVLTILGRTNMAASPLVVATLLDALILIFWTVWPSQARVRDAGWRYAERLLDAAAELRS